MRNVIIVINNSFEAGYKTRIKIYDLSALELMKCYVVGRSPYSDYCHIVSGEDCYGTLRIGDLIEKSGKDISILSFIDKNVALDEESFYRKIFSILYPEYNIKSVIFA